MRSLTFIMMVGCVVGGAGVIQGDEELNEHNKIYRRWWGADLERKYDKLPTKGIVPDSRLPYSGYYYPDVRGGTQSALRKYDMAYNGRRLKATAFEQWDTTAFAQPMQVQHRAGLFGRRTITETVVRTPNWHGHCNGWSAATIRHAEPTRNVVHNGVTFTPADIKALLAELYMYSQYEELEGSTGLVDAAGLHISLTNWLGTHSHPLAMEAMPGREKWNYPVYGYESTSTKRGSSKVDVKTTLYYMYYSNGEYQKSPRLKRYKQFHYALNLNDIGEVTSGYFYNDSSRIDLLWVPLYPAKGGSKANPRGNPHVDVEAVLAMWRESVTDDAIASWVNIDSKGESLLPTPKTPQVAEGASAPAVVPAGYTEPATGSDNATAPSTTERNDERGGAPGNPAPGNPPTSN